MIPEERLIKTKTGEQFIIGYFLTPAQLEGLINYFTVSDPMDYRMFHVKQYIEQYLKRIEHD